MHGTVGQVAHGAWLPASRWRGRTDSDTNRDAWRWHQCVQAWDGKTTPGFTGTREVWFIGCPTDIGVRRNRGRPGAAAAPALIRHSLANLPVRFDNSVTLLDAGDLAPLDDDLEELSERLEELVATIISAGGHTVLLGGGHEVAYGHHRGLRKGLLARGMESPAIISFDAHFDLRPEGSGQERIHSGNMFTLLASEYRDASAPFRYSVAGIQRSANTRSLFGQADLNGVRSLLAMDIRSTDTIEAFLAPICNKKISLHTSLCTDVLCAAHAPAVSAPQPFGLDPELVLAGLRYIARNGNPAGLDVCEVSPRFEGDDSTAHMVAVLIFAWVNALAGAD